MEEEPYAYWFGDALTEFEYHLYLQDILLDNIIEEYVNAERLDEARYYIDLIKQKPND
jgi:glutamine synthetase